MNTCEYCQEHEADCSCENMPDNAVPTKLFQAVEDGYVWLWADVNGKYYRVKRIGKLGHCLNGSGG